MTSRIEIKFILRKFLFLILMIITTNTYAWVGMETPKLHIEGRNLKDPHGNTVILHGFAQTYSPYFNQLGQYWTNYNVSGCLSYNKDLIDKILTAGWKMNFIRLHMDPYWSNTPGVSTTGESDITAFDMTRFKTYLDQVFIPMAEYATSKGLYVIMRPPGVCPEKIMVGDAYNKYLISVWEYVSQQPKLRNNPAIMFELAKITDESKNVSWLLFTEPWRLAQFTGTPPAAGDAYTFLNDPQACPLPSFNWYKDYALVNYPRPDFTSISRSDNGDGTFTNPVVFGDFPDPDVIRVGDIYYMSTTTMHNFPGATILKSYDLVNWEYCSNPLEKIESSDCYNCKWQRCNYL